MPLVRPFNSFACWHLAARRQICNLCLGFQCFSVDTITNFLFGTSFGQLPFPDFHGDIVEGADVAMPTIALRKFSSVFVWVLRNFPVSILVVISPDSMKGSIVFKNVSLTSLSLSCPIKDLLLGGQSPDRKHLAKSEVVGRCTTPHYVQ
jgi:hypothetical protein